MVTSPCHSNDGAGFDLRLRSARPSGALAGDAGGRLSLGSTTSSVNLANRTRHQGLGAVKGTGPLPWVGGGGEAYSRLALVLALALGQEAGGKGRSYQQVLLLELGDHEPALPPVFLDGLLDTCIEGVKLHPPLFLLFQSILENVQADDDKFVLVGEDC